ncbi:hypothetical protein [Macrococcus armenti]|uniref:hypothetical protein n=1 Tax=Macrococcus armenti TaxID=2875764 RepID=UPI001CCAB0B1|nr:hypothetical protein [Macrococcus armenti]UBH16619.1 hypothetical protein LAU44_11955 [Macrococcus armenti]UBH21253.1 hypothetical protein LAU40_11990 [Macrococcus armenti]
MLKVLFKNLPKEFQKISKLSNKQQYYISDVNDKFHELIEASDYEYKKNSQYLKISFDLINENGIQAFIVEDYIVDGKLKSIQDIVKYELDTQYIDENEYDNGMSNLEEDKKDLLNEINDSLEIKATRSNKSISRTKKPGIFKIKNFLHKKEKKNEEETIFPFEETPNDTEEYIKPPVDEETKTDIDINDVEDKKESVIEDEQTDEVNEVEKDIVVSQTIMDHVENMEVVESKGSEEQHPSTTNETKISFDIPQFQKQTPILSLPQSDDYFTKEVQEYLNLFEIEKTNIINNNIERINNSIITFVQEKTIEAEKELQNYVDLNKPTDDDLQDFKNALMQDHMRRLEKFKNSQTETFDNLMNKKKEQHDIEIEKFKELKASELEEYKIGLERSQKSEFESEISRYRAIADEDIDRERMKQSSIFKENVDAYNQELLTATKESVYALYKKHEQETYPDVERFNKELTEEIQKIKSEITQNDLERKKEINKNEILNNERLEKENIANKLRNEEKSLKLKEEEIQSVNKKKEILLLEKEKAERELQERKLRLEEDKQEKEFEARMKELELKYNTKKQDGLKNNNQTTNQKQSSNKGTKGFLSGVLASLLLGAGVYGGYNAYEEHQNSYSTLLNDKNYTEIAKEYPDRLNTLSLQLYKNRDYDALEKLSNATNNPFVTFRRDLATRNQEKIIKSFESLNDYNLLTNDELEHTANIYISKKELAKAEDINKQLNDERIQKKINEERKLTQKKETKSEEKKQ